MTKTPSAATGANVRAEMARLGVSQTTLASQLGIGQSGLSKRLRGQIPFDINELMAVATALDVPLDRLLDGVAA